MVFGVVTMPAMNTFTFFSWGSEESSAQGEC